MRRIVSGLALSAVSLVLVLGLAEAALAALGLWHPTTHHKELIQHDPDLGWSLKPGVTARCISDEYSTTVAVNSKGQRGPEFPYEKPAGEFRILVAGDSFVEGYTVEFDETFHQVMASELGKPYRIINQGTIGYSLDQGLIAYRREGRKYSADLVILAFYLNDVIYNITPTGDGGAFKPQFHLNGDGSLSLPTKVLVGSHAIGPLNRIAIWLSDHSHLWTLLQAARTFSSLQKRPLSNYYHVWQEKPGADVDKAWRMTEALLVEFQKEVSAAGGRFVIFYVPHWATVYGLDFGIERLAYARYEKELDPGIPAVRLRALCEKHGIPLIDPTQEMRELAKTSPTLLYLKKDTHWTVAGNRAAGKILARAVRRLD